MEDKLIEILTKAFGLPVFLQGSMLPDEPYPESFFTFWNDSADGTSYYDNNENGIIWQYSLNFYSSNPNFVNSMLLAAKVVLKMNGWTVNGAGYSLLSDEKTHTGRGIDITYLEV